MARSTYRIKRWFRNAKDWRDYIIYLGQVRRKGDRVIPISLRLSAGNVLFPGFVTDKPEWFQNGVDFTLTLPGSVVINFTWSADRWTTGVLFPSISGSGTLTQGANVHPAEYSNAEYPSNLITAEDDIKITAMNGLYISWS